MLKQKSLRKAWGKAASRSPVINVKGREQKNLSLFLSKYCENFWKIVIGTRNTRKAVEIKHYRKQYERVEKKVCCNVLTGTDTDEKRNVCRVEKIFQ